MNVAKPAIRNEIKIDGPEYLAITSPNFKGNLAKIKTEKKSFK